MDIHHDAPRLSSFLLSLVGVRAHLNPFRVERRRRFPPLPPLLAADLLDTVWAKLLLKKFSGACQLIFGDGDIFDFDPLGMRYPLRGECLEFFNSVV
jgi:hypothetical protein